MPPEPFERTRDAILKSTAAYYGPRAGEVFAFATGDFHEGSISVRGLYGEVAFVFTGAAEGGTRDPARRGGAPRRGSVNQGLCPVYAPRHRMMHV